MPSPERHYLIDPDNFQGHINTSVTNGFADYSGYLYNDKGPNLTVEEYRKLPGHENLKLVTRDELDDLLERFYREAYTSHPPVQTTEERYYDALGAVPPLITGGGGGVAFFLMSEFTDGPITAMYARKGDQYLYKQVDSRNKATWIKPEDFRDFPNGPTGVST